MKMLVTRLVGHLCATLVAVLLLSSVGCVTYYADGVFDEVYQNRLAFGHVAPCPECIGLIAVLNRQHVGKLAFVTRPGLAEEGPFLIADCAAAKDLVRLRSRGLVAEVDWETAQRWGMRAPLYGVTVRIVERFAATDPPPSEAVFNLGGQYAR